MASSNAQAAAAAALAMGLVRRETTVEYVPRPTAPPPAEPVPVKATVFRKKGNAIVTVTAGSTQRVVSIPLETHMSAWKDEDAIRIARNICML